jgi:hypothetical protein
MVADISCCQVSEMYVCVSFKLETSDAYLRVYYLKD